MSFVLSFLKNVSCDDGEIFILVENWNCDKIFFFVDQRDSLGRRIFFFLILLISLLFLTFLPLIFFSFFFFNEENNFANVKF